MFKLKDYTLKTMPPETKKDYLHEYVFLKEYLFLKKMKKQSFIVKILEIIQ